MSQNQPAKVPESYTRDAIYVSYLIAMFAVSIVTFGTTGVAFGLIAVGFWACVFASRSMRVWFRATLMVLLTPIVLFLFALNTPLHGPMHQEATWRMSCINNLKNLAMALHNYHDVYKSFPPAYIADEDSQPMHSWRVLILPYLREDQTQLYDAYNFAEPWDGPSNRDLLHQMPHVFCCSSQWRHGSEPTGLTTYFAVVGDGTVWPGEKATGFADITDGTSNTLLLLEATERPIAWTDPNDIPYSDAIDVLTSDQLAPHQYKGFFYDQPAGRNLAMADGSVQFVAQQAATTAGGLLITRNDGQRFSVDALQQKLAPRMPLHTGNCIRLAAFLFLAIFPFPWVWITPK